MLKRAVCFAFVLWLNWSASASALNADAPTGDCGAAGGSFYENAQGSQAPVNAAERDAALAEIKKIIAGREDEPAEKVFKNIEILKGKTASRLPGMMAALTGLIGVDCTYCHVKDKWDSDEKQAKQTARKMFRMIGTINGDFFGGQNKVSCWTCHRGNPRPPISG